MLPFYNYQAVKCVQEERLREAQPNQLTKPKLRHRLCCRVGTWMIALGERLTAVAPPTPSATDLELA